ncbi:hypothetical protein GCM10023094_56230 [Rhodococcus olei]|uniref:Uncharacterized protein n=1 Tax=Rhodococcus olei TaxID=2161675 RepID=A0ABP8PTG7_9NOCA
MDPVAGNGQLPDTVGWLPGSIVPEAEFLSSRTVGFVLVTSGLAGVEAAESDGDRLCPGCSGREFQPGASGMGDDPAGDRKDP